MNGKLEELKQAYHEAEERSTDAYRRAKWMEKHLYDSPTEEIFNQRLEALKEQEKEVERLAIITNSARIDYGQMEVALSKCPPCMIK